MSPVFRRSSVTVCGIALAVAARGVEGGVDQRLVKARLPDDSGQLLVLVSPLSTGYRARSKGRCKASVFSGQSEDVHTFEISKIVGHLKFAGIVA